MHAQNEPLHEPPPLTHAVRSELVHMEQPLSDSVEVKHRVSLVSAAQ